MNFISIAFAVFILIFLIVWYLVPKRYRYIVLTIGSWIFYGWGDASMLVTLLVITAWTWVGGLILERYNKTVWYVVFFAGNIAMLGWYKYTAFVLSNLQRFAVFRQGFLANESLMNIVAPIGISFMIFQTCTYLGDVHHGKMRAERNPLRYAAFVSFFPSVLSGPIQRARDLLPQICLPADFDSEEFIRGFLYFLWGIFEKICISGQLSLLTGDPPEGVLSGPAWYLLSAIAFSLYIYADFSGYSDMAIGLGKMLGIRLQPNFNNPYLSRSLSEFWNRWHMSLNQWLIEYIYIPLGGNRKGTIRKYINVMVVFFLSGLWHGASWHFIAWGVVNGILVVIGQILRPLRKHVWHKLKIDEDDYLFRHLQQGIVFLMISMTWLFFAHGIGTAANMVRSIITAAPTMYCDTTLWNAYGSTSKTVAMIILTGIFVYMQCRRNGRSDFITRFRNRPLVMQWVVIGVMLSVCVFVYCASYTTVNTEFLYFQF